MPKSEINKKFVQIVKFADIGDFITAPLYTYSSGMKLRLVFSVAIHAEPDMLLFDEVMVMGDENFKKKSTKIVKEMFKERITILMVSQWLDYLKSNCDRLIGLRNV